MTSQAKIDANRRNAARSTGPKTDEGKARSRQNALKHGFAAELLVVEPVESAQQFQEVIKAWRDDAKPIGIIERTLVDQAARASWKLQRADACQAALARIAARRAGDDLDEAARVAAAQLGDRLLFDPFNRCATPKRHDPDYQARVDQFRRDDPHLLAGALEQTRQGVDWKLDRWAELRRVLEIEGYWHYHERYIALRLAGRRPYDVLIDGVVERITLACNVLHPEAWPLWDDCHQATLGVEDRPIYIGRVVTMEDRKPTREQALEHLWQLHDAEVARLQALKSDRLDARSEADRRDAAEAAAITTGPAAALLLRYEAAAERTLHRTLAELARRQKLRPDDAPAYEPEPAPDDAPAYEPEPAPEPPAPRPSPRPTPPAPTPPSPRTMPLTGAKLAEMYTCERLLGADWAEREPENDEVEHFERALNEAKLRRALARHHRDSPPAERP